jgi:hypothetical protein
MTGAKSCCADGNRREEGGMIRDEAEDPGKAMLRNQRGFAALGGGKKS